MISLKYRITANADVDQPKEATMNTETRFSEEEFSSFNGYVMGIIALTLLGAGVYALISLGDSNKLELLVVGFMVGKFVLGGFLLAGLYMLQPNEGALITLFGDYRGTDRSSGLRWCFPFYTRKKISLRSRNLNSDKLKVNDKNGNPIEIGAAIVWRGRDTAAAVVEIDDYELYVRVQSEAAIRHLASAYNYDNGGHETARVTILTLRGGPHRGAPTPTHELQEPV